ncbi:N-acyl homoserine lactonase AttM [archaeon HR03]|uniref:Beta-lactamase domain protein n=2 Tax=Thermoproteati TaxID=1783275 RepID=E6NAN1_CALS0|nr:beta-lactamase domain protein [Candidatus Caldarchaeum subterraneum]BAL57044.1 beta-lactamase domain protein [uncultured crenarchaeote]GBC72184.1 N-acyl homoserine lactonase AttM [archaeon HR03]
MIITDRLAVVDTHGYGHEKTIASYILRGREVAVFDAGYSPGADHILRAMGELGIDPGDVTAIFLTHHHMDHAGGVYRLVKSFPEAVVVTHEDNVRFLLDTPRIVEATVASFGEDLSTHLGDMKPIQPERIEVLKEDVYDFGGVRVHPIKTPGHTPSHYSFLIEEENAVVTGDAVCAMSTGQQLLLPAASPPMYDVPSALMSLEKLESLKPSLLLTPHFGPHRLERGWFEKHREAVEWWLERVKLLLGEGRSAKEIAEAMRRELLNKTGLRDNELDHYTRDVFLGRLLPLTVQGFLGYLMTPPRRRQ